MVETGFEKVKESMSEKSLDPDYSGRRPFDIKERLDLESIKKGKELFMKRYSVELKARLLLSKRGAARFIPHIDFMEVLKRGLRMAGAPVSFTQGFNKRERISMGFPLPLGIESGHELLDLELFEELGPGFIDSFNAKLPAGIVLHSYRYFDGKSSLMAISAAAQFRVRINRSDLMERVRESCEKKISLIKKSKKGEKSVSFDEAVESFGFSGDILTIRLFTGTPSSVRIDSLLETLTGQKEFRNSVDILKTGTFEERGGEYILLE
jgi:radical SAM-linked protein